MGRKLIRILAALSAVLLCAGCWDAKDINQKDITTVASVDYRDGLFYFYTEIPNLSFKSGSGQGQNGGKSGQDIFNVIVSSGKTFKDARDNLNAKLEKPLALGTVRVIILSVDMAKSGHLAEFLYRIREDVNYRKTARVATTRDDLAKLLNTNTENEVSSGNAIEHTLDSQAENGNAFKVTTGEILENLSSKHICFIIPNFDVQDSDIALTGYSIIHKGKYVGFIPYEQSTGTLFFLNPIAKAVYTVPYGKETATVEVKLDDKRIRPHYLDNKIRFNVDFAFKSTVKYLSCGSVFDPAAQDAVRINLQKVLLKDISGTITLAQSVYKCDFLDFDQSFRIAYPQEFKKLHWYSEFLNAEFNISVKTDLDPGGEMDYTFQTRP